MSDKPSVQAWIQRANDVHGGQTSGMVCPECGHETLGATFIPFNREVGGEFHLRCSNCGAQNFMLAADAPHEDREPGPGESG